MAVIKLGDLTTFEGDASGSWLVMNDPTNTATYKVQREQLMSGSTSLSASYALTASYVLQAVSSSYAVTASWALDAALTASNAITRTGSFFELGGQLYKDTIISGTKDGTLNYSYPTSSFFTALGGILIHSSSEYGYFMGYSSSIENPNPKGIAKVNLITNQLDETFNSSGVGVSGEFGLVVDCLLLDDGKIYIVGNFNSYNGVSRNHIARINPDGTLDTSFDPGTGFAGFSQGNFPYTIAFCIFIDDNGKLVVGGSFNSYNGVSSPSVIRLNQDGSVDNTFTSPGSNGTITNVLKAPGNKIYIIGNTTSPFSRIARLNSNGSIDATFDGSGLNGGIVYYGKGQAILDTQNRLLIVGNFTTYKGTTVNRIVRINPDGSRDSTFNVGGTGFTSGNFGSTSFGYVTLDSQNRIYVVSPFTTYNGQSIGKIVRLLPDGAIDREFYAGIGFTVSPSISYTGRPAAVIDRNYLYVNIQYDESAGVVYDRRYNGTQGGRIWRININENNLLFSKTVLNYDRDESPFFTSRSLVDKTYVDSRVSSVFPFTGSAVISGSLTVTGSTNLQALTASNILTTGNITAQTLVVQTITSSVDFVTGSTRFGSLLTDTHQFTGSVSVTGSFSVSGTISTNKNANINSLTVGIGSGNNISNTVLGYEPLFFNTSGTDNIAIGLRALYSNLSARYNVAIGTSTLYYNTVGENNTAIGYYALLNNGSSGNTAVGSEALYQNTLPNNTAVGYKALRNLVNVGAGLNVSLGYQAGMIDSLGSQGQRMQTSVFIGSDTKPKIDSDSNQIVIGYQSIGLGSNTTVIGNSSTATTWLGGDLLIGTTTGSGYRATISGSSASGSLNVNNTLYVTGSRVGVGTSSPSASLDVSGSARITANLTASRAFLSSSNGTASGSTLIVFGSGSAQPVFTVQGSQGELFSVNDSLSGSLFSVNDISGLPIIEAFSDNRILIGSYQAPMLTTTVRTTLNSGSNVIYQNVPTASYDAVFFEYSLKSGSNARAGSIMGIWSGSDANYNEVVTTDFGDTTGVKFMVMVTGSSVALTGSATTANWTMKTIVRSI